MTGLLAARRTQIYLDTMDSCCSTATTLRTYMKDALDKLALTATCPCRVFKSAVRPIRATSMEARPRGERQLPPTRCGELQRP